MVSFQCDGCADTVKKPKLDQHRQRCWASFTCLDCSQTFQNQDYKKHTSCISEAEKYQGALYRGAKKGKPTPVSSFTEAPPVASSSSSPLPSQASIHPDRLTKIDAPQYTPRGGPANRGRGMQNGQHKMSGENRAGPKGGMRTWGSRAPTPEPPTPPQPAPTKVEPTATSSKKRKREETESAGVPAKPLPESSEPSSKLLKRLRQKAAKLAAQDKRMNLDQFTQKLCQGKKDHMDVSQLLQHASVHYDGVKWVLDL